MRNLRLNFKKIIYTFLFLFSIVYISTYIHANIRMDVANHIVDVYSYAAVLS